MVEFSPDSRRADDDRDGASPARAALEATLAEALSSGESSRGQPAGRANGHAHRTPTSSPPSARPEAPGPHAPRIEVVLDHSTAPSDKHRLPFVQNPDSPVAAAYRVLRHKLREVGSPRAIAVTSPNAKEGKTSCCIDLAMALAEHGRASVLLVEANFRFPGIASALGFATPACFGAQMAAHKKAPNLPWQVTSAFFPNLHVLAVDPDSADQWVLRAPLFKAAMDQLHRAGYEHIIVDCPHALGSADVNVIEDSTDGVLLTAMSGKTSAESLERAARHLAPANILGVVLVSR